jgi:hypothetical protein
VKTLLTATLILALALTGTPAARAQVFGQYGGATPVAMNGHQFGAYLNSSQDVVGLAAQLRLSFYPGVDFGFYGGLDRVPFPGRSDRTTIRLATDVRIAAARHSQAFPLDLSVVGALGVESGDSYQVLVLGPFLQASRDYGGAASGATLYSGIGLAYSSIDVGPTNKNEMSLPLRGGIEWRVASDVRIVGEIQLRLHDTFNDDVGFSAGVNLPF